MAQSLVVFSDDWGRHPTSCQHLIRNLLPDPQVLWVNMIGMRRPRLDIASFRRGWEKIAQWFGPKPTTESCPVGLTVISPRVWPGFGYAIERKLNRRWLVRQVQPAIERLAEPPVAVTTMTTVVDLMGKLPVARWVYYCVDDFSQWPGLDQRTVRKLEDELIAKADRVIVVSDALKEHVGARGREAELLTHGVDLEFWARNEPAARANISRILFWGLIDRRMDYEFVHRLSRDLTEAEIVLVGPQDNADPRLHTLPHLTIRTGVSLQDLPGLAADAAVLIMPYSDLPVTRAMQPLKLKEYLATGKPVVVSDLPSVREWADCLDVANSPETFSAAVRMRLRTGLPETQRRARERLVSESWKAKAERFRQLILSESGITPGKVG